MRLGVFARTFAGDTPLAVMRAARAAGFGAVHYNFACSGLAAMPDRVDGAACEAVRAAARDTGVAVVGLSATYNMAHPDAGVRADGARRLRGLVAAARAIGAPLVTVCSGSRDADDQWRAHPANRSPEAWDDMIAAMRDALAAADAHGVAIGVEPERANVVRDADAAERLLAELPHPRLRLVLDPANLFESEARATREALIADAVARLAPRTAMAHAKDRTEAGGVAAAGDGVIDFAGFVARLRTAGFDGPLVAHGCTAAEAPAVARRLGRLEGVT